MRFLSIIFLSILASVIYGIIHDQITARICVEYFTIGHPPVFDTADPTLLALGWGTIATWWVGLILGVLLAIAARMGSWPRLSASQLVRPLGMMLAIVGILAAVAGLIGHYFAVRQWVVLVEPLASQIPADKQIPFITDLWMHLASYIFGFLGGIVLCIRLVIVRWRLQKKRVSALTGSNGGT